MNRGQLSFLQTKINERTYLLLCDPMSPIYEIREAFSKFLEELDKIEKEHLEAQLKKEEPLTPVDEVTNG